jgi:hypothetical protein
MRRLLVMAILGICLNGCSELRIIGNAAVRELQCEAISVEWKAYHEVPIEIERPRDKRILMAKAERKFSPFRNTNSEGRLPKKGLWEMRSRPVLVSSSRQY